MACSFWRSRLSRRPAYFIWPAAAAFIVGVVIWVEPQMTWVFQVLMFSILALGSLIVWRAGPWRKAQPSDHPLLNRRGAQYIGRTATVVETFHTGRGQVELDDTRWRAECVTGASPAENDTVRVTAIEGTLLVVEPETT